MAQARLLAEWFWTDRWERSQAALLPLEARGLYRELLSRAWARGARLPNHPPSLQRLVGASDAEWLNSWRFVEPYWHPDASGHYLVNDTQLEIYAEAQAMAERASERGRRGGIARAQGLPDA
jgi:hypothetical protein